MVVRTAMPLPENGMIDCVENPSVTQFFHIGYDGVHMSPKKQICKASPDEPTPKFPPRIPIIIIIRRKHGSPSTWRCNLTSSDAIYYDLSVSQISSSSTHLPFDHSWCSRRYQIELYGQCGYVVCDFGSQTCSIGNNTIAKTDFLP